jgi:hypothetical protein
MFCLPGSGAAAATPCSTGEPAAPGEALGLAAASVGYLPELNGSFRSLNRSCDSGGIGSASCDLYLSISIGWIGGDAGCGVSCADGFYACCNHAGLTSPARCSCEVSPPPIASFPNPEDLLPVDRDAVTE